MDEQRVREIVREELAEFKKQTQPAVTLTTKVQLCDADAVVDRFAKRLQEEMSKSLRPNMPWN